MFVLSILVIPCVVLANPFKGNRWKDVPCIVVRRSWKHRQRALWLKKLEAPWCLEDSLKTDQCPADTPQTAHSSEPFHWASLSRFRNDHIRSKLSQHRANCPEAFFTTDRYCLVVSLLASRKKGLAGHKMWPLWERYTLSDGIAPCAGVCAG